MTMALLAALAALLVAVATAAGVWLQYLSNRREGEHDDVEMSTDAQDRARSEAESLAQTRGEMVLDLRNRVDDLQKQLGREREHSDAAVHRLEEALKLSREEAQETQRLLVVGFKGVLTKIHGHLHAATPIELEAAKAYVAEMLAGDLNVRSRRPRSS